MLKIYTGEDNPVLREKAAPIAKIDSKIKKLIKEMEGTMKESDGVGLAAPQVGESVRLLLAHFNYGTDQSVIIAMINPEIIKLSEATVCGEEGCLSLPKQFVQVERAQEIVVTFHDKKMQKQTLVLSEMNARIVQHEIDHLDGILMTDRATM